ncbi:MAG: hypothetical protein ABI685_06425 [Ferruginibacter sp.]
MKFALILVSCCLLFSCSDSFINHELKSEKLGDCTDYPPAINMISNINGERYEFLSCIDDGFDGKNYTLVRRGDSVIVDFPKTDSKKKSLYKLILDVDAKPNYHHIILDGRNVTVVPAEK